MCIRDSITRLDVRTPAEYAGGCADGFVNIPVDELRGRIGEIDPGKPVYVMCQSALRSYIAVSYTHLDVYKRQLIGTDTFTGGEVSFRQGPITKCARLGGFGILDAVSYTHLLP